MLSIVEKETRSALFKWNIRFSLAALIVQAWSGYAARAESIEANKIQSMTRSEKLIIRHYPYRANWMQVDRRLTAAGETDLALIGLGAIAGAVGYGVNFIKHQVRPHGDGYRVLSSTELKQLWDKRQHESPAFEGTLEQFRQITVNTILDRACTARYRGKQQPGILSPLYSTEVDYAFIPEKSEIRTLSSTMSSAGKLPRYEDTVVSTLACMPKQDTFALGWPSAPQQTDPLAAGPDEARSEAVFNGNEAPSYPSLRPHPRPNSNPAQSSR
jgi:hypothetical protein